MRVLRVSHSAVVDAWRERERELQSRGHTVNVASAITWNEGGAPVHLRPRPDEPVTGIRTVGTHPALFLYDPRPLWRLLGRPWDVIDIHEEPFALATAEVLLLRALRRQRAPYVLYSAQNIAKRYPPPFRWLERWALRHAAGASVCNEAAGEILARKGLPARARVIPLGTDLSRFCPAGPLRPAAHDVVVGYAGRLDEHKGVRVLLDAVAATLRLRLRLAGDGPLRPELEGDSTARGLADRVEFMGSLGQEELASFYRSVDIVAVPSLTTPSWVEQFGRVAVEAMACGTPVVASDSGALPDVVGPAGLLVPPGDAEALAESLLQVGTDPGLRDRLVAAGLEFAARTSWDKVAGQYESLYLAALGTRAPTTGGSAAHGTMACATDAGTEALPPLEVVVVAYGAPDLLDEALAAASGLPVTVVDNSSRPDVRDIARAHGARYVDPGRNGGFSAGVNVGLSQSTPGADVLLLNPDARITADAARHLQAALRSAPEIASVSPRIFHPDGTEERSSWPFPTPMRACIEAVGAARLLGAGAQYVIGTVLLLRAEALAQVGGFDEDFFLYAEETDWARRAHRLGWRHVAVPSVTATHVGAGTSTDPSRREINFHAGQERYYRKHHGVLGWQVARAAQLVGSSARMLLGGERAEGARQRRSLYLRGPMRVEAPSLAHTRGGPS